MGQRNAEPAHLNMILDLVSASVSINLSYQQEIGVVYVIGETHAHVFIYAGVDGQLFLDKQ